jgi:hypothetical protein
MTASKVKPAGIRRWEQRRTFLAHGNEFLFSNFLCVFFWTFTDIVGKRLYALDFVCFLSVTIKDI